MRKRKRDEGELTMDEGLRNDVKKMAFEQRMIEDEVDEVLAYEQFIRDEVASKESMISERWAMLENWSIRELWMVWGEHPSINYLLIIRDQLLMEEEFEKDRILMEEAFLKGEIPTWDDRDAMNYLLEYLSEIQSIKDRHWYTLDVDEEKYGEEFYEYEGFYEYGEEFYEYGEEFYKEWISEQNSLTEEQKLMNKQRKMEEAMMREQDIKSIGEKKMEKLLVMQEELIMDEVLMMDELLIASEESMGSQKCHQDTIEEESIDYEQAIKDEILDSQVGWYLMASAKNEQLSIFNYTPLDQAKHEIRIVRLHPGPRLRQSPIVCDLITVDLRSAPIYEALSYEWGSPFSKKYTIRLNERLFVVRENLWRALYHLRDSREPRTFWIDALCNNQADVHERNYQVSRMGDIYSQAARVVAWIGEDDHEARKGRAFLSELASCSVERYCPPNDSCLRWQHRGKWAALSSLCTRSYWSRLWIIQEVLLAFDLVIQCGQLSFQWEEVSNVFHYLRENLTGFCSPEQKHSVSWVSRELF
jgi:hypothetical protein